MRPAHLLPVAAVLTATLAPVAAYAQAVGPDAPTLAAINALRTSAAALVSPAPAWAKGVTSSQLTASYSDQLKDLSSQRMNTVMVVKNQAEQSAWTSMDPTSRALIKSFLAGRH